MVDPAVAPVEQLEGHLPDPDPGQLLDEGGGPEVEVVLVCPAGVDLYPA